jgi:hypothetical protein
MSFQFQHNLLRASSPKCNSDLDAAIKEWCILPNDASPDGEQQCICGRSITNVTRMWNAGTKVTILVGTGCRKKFRKIAENATHGSVEQEDQMIDTKQGRYDSIINIDEYNLAVQLEHRESWDKLIDATTSAAIPDLYMKLYELKHQYNLDYLDEQLAKLREKLSASPKNMFRDDLERDVASSTLSSICAMFVRHDAVVEIGTKYELGTEFDIEVTTALYKATDEALSRLPTVIAHTRVGCEQTKKVFEGLDRIFCRMQSYPTPDVELRFQFTEVVRRMAESCTHELIYETEHELNGMAANYVRNGMAANYVRNGKLETIKAKIMQMHTLVSKCIYAIANKWELANVHYLCKVIRTCLMNMDVAIKLKSLWDALRIDSPTCITDEIERNTLQVREYMDMARRCIGNKDYRDDLCEKRNCNYYNAPSLKTIDEHFRHIPNGRAGIIDNIRTKLDAVKSVREVGDKLRQLESLRCDLRNANVENDLSEMNAEIHKEINIAKADECRQKAEIKLANDSEIKIAEEKERRKKDEIRLAHDSEIKIAEENERRKKDEIRLAVENSHKPFLSGSNWG